MKDGEDPVNQRGAASTWEALGLFALSGTMYGLSYMFVAAGPIQFVSFVPALLATCHPRYGQLSWVRFFLASLGFYPAALLSTSIPFFTFSYVAGFVLPLFVFMWGIPPFLVARWIFRRVRIPLVLLWPAAWILTEWIWSNYSLGRLAYGLSSYPLAFFPPVIQIADFAGVYGVTGLICLTSAALAEAAIAGRACWKSFRSKGSLILASTALALALGYGYLRLHQTNLTEGPRLALVQPNLDHDISQTTRVHLLQLGFAIEHVPRDTGVELVAFPESSLTDLIYSDRYFADFRETAEKIGAPLLVGAFGLHPDSEGMPVEEAIQKYGRTNSAFLLSEDAEILGRYSKIHLLPFAEYVPLREFLQEHSPTLLDAQETLIRMLIGYSPGGARGGSVELMELPAKDGDLHRFWTPICFETANNNLAREAVQAGAEFFINMTSEGKLGPQIFRGMLAVSTFRAVENRVCVARATNTGITTFVRPDGTHTPFLQGLEGRLWNDAGILVGNVSYDPRRGTFYTRHGDWLVFLSASFLALSVLLSFVLPTIRSRSSGDPSGDEVRE